MSNVKVTHFMLADSFSPKPTIKHLHHLRKIIKDAVMSYNVAFKLGHGYLRPFCLGQVLNKRRLGTAGINQSVRFC